MPLNKTNIRRVLEEMRRLRGAIDELENERALDPSYEHLKQTGAVRRASMDLTRALADLRRSEWGNRA